MANKRHKPEEIVTKLRQVEVLCGQGMPRIDAIRQVQKHMTRPSRAQEADPPHFRATAGSKRTTTPPDGRFRTLFWISELNQNWSSDVGTKPTCPAQASFL